MSSIYKCDRKDCGKVIDRNDSTYTIEIENKRYDVCQECLEFIRDHFNKKEVLEDLLN